MSAVSNLNPAKEKRVAEILVASACYRNSGMTMTRTDAISWDCALAIYVVGSPDISELAHLLALPENLIRREVAILEDRGWLNEMSSNPELNQVGRAAVRTFLGTQVSETSDR